MEKGRKRSSPIAPQAEHCPACRTRFSNGDCQCPGPPDITPKASSSQLLNGESLLEYTKTNVVRNVPDTIVSTSSDTKQREGDETKQISRIETECLNYDKEAVNLDSCSARVGPESNIFEKDFDCVDSSSRRESSQRAKDKQSALERTPVKQVKPSSVPSAPQKLPPNTASTPGVDHKDYVARAPRHACPYCSKTFRSNGKLNSHVFSHTGERPFACKHCQKAFSSKFKLVRHLLIHSEERKFLCTVCERRFLRNDHLKNHYKVHDPRKVVYPCERPGCEKEYSSALSQRKHEAWHRAQDGNLTCLLCDIKHETVADLLVHLRRHSGSRMLKTPADRKFRCHVCDRNFLTRKDVTRHLVVHTGERDFLCQFCPQRFGRKDHLIRHIKKSHHGNGKKRGARKGTKESNEKADGEEEEEIDDEDGEDPEDDMFDVLDDDDDGLSTASALAHLDESNEAKVPLDLDDIITSELLAPSTSAGFSSDSGVIPSPQATPSNVDLNEGANFIQHSENLASLSDSISQEQNVPIPDNTMSSDLLGTQQAIDIFGFEAPSTSTDLSTENKKDGELFEGTSRTLMYAEPSFGDEFKSTDFLLNQAEDASSGELLRYLLQSDSDAPLPGFNQIFTNSGPPKT